MKDSEKIDLMEKAANNQARIGNPLAMELKKAARRHDHRDREPVLVTAFNGMRNLLEEYSNLMSSAMIAEAGIEHPEVIIPEDSDVNKISD
jgi:hypothetical protein